MRVPLADIGVTTFAVEWESGQGMTTAQEDDTPDELLPIWVASWVPGRIGPMDIRRVATWDEVRALAAADGHDTVIDCETADDEED